MAAAEREILQQAEQNALLPLRVVFFTPQGEPVEYLQQRERIEALNREIFGERCPLLALVVQPPLQCSLMAEVNYLDKGCELEYHDNYIIADGKQLYTGGFCSTLNKSIEEQSDDVFLQLGSVLSREGFAIDDIVRQWNYIEYITHCSTEGQHYQQFNDSRSRFYERVEWRNGYPAATGIGTCGGGVVVVVDAVKQSAETSRALDNPLQLSAHSYSQQVLIEGRDPQRKTTPKFERARWVGDDGEGMIYISGTAAIRGEASLRTDVVQQGVTTMENIDCLTSAENQARHGVPTPEECEYEMLRVYVKHEAGWQQVEAWLRENYPCSDVAFVVADICREELLIEIEGIAKKK
ncbi:MAG: hypothetical protein IJA57_07145 [Alistipes sp.]|nr:hypothetical protein [Alistipes sp.]